MRMIMKKNITAIAVGALCAAWAGTWAQASTAAAGTGEHCTYAVDASQAKVEWTAYKTTEKVGVKGTFAKVEIKAGKPAASIPALLDGASASIEGLSVDSGNPVRDENLRKGFFGLLAKGASIQGKLAKAKGDATQGELVLELSMNGKLGKVPMKYTVGDAGLEATGSMDILNLGGAKALESLAQLCFEQHKGKDGVSKTWSEVGLRIAAPVSKTCK